MTIKTKPDGDAQLETISAIYEFVLDIDAANVAIGKMADLLKSDKAMMVRLADDRRRDIVLASHGFERDTMNTILRDRENAESFLARTDRWHAGGIATDGDYCDKQPCGEPRKPTSLYPDSLKLSGIDHTLLGIVATSDIHHIVMWFHRDADTGPYSKAEMGTYTALMPHWQRACQLKLVLRLARQRRRRFGPGAGSIAFRALYARPRRQYRILQRRCKETVQRRGWNTTAQSSTRIQRP